MRELNVFAAISGALALTMLVIAAHAVADDAEAVARIQTGAYIQMFAALAALILSGRSGRLNLIAGIMILAGAGLFSAVLYTLALSHERGFVMLAPVGGITLILGWIALAFTKPRD